MKRHTVGELISELQKFDNSTRVIFMTYHNDQEFAMCEVDLTDDCDKDPAVEDTSLVVIEVK